MESTMVKAPAWYSGQFGVPGADTPHGFRLKPDALTFYVDKGHGNTSDNNDGTDPNAPLTSLGQAMTNAVDGRGDVIWVAPGTYNPTAAITVNKSDVMILGMGIGGNPLQPENGTVFYPAASYTTGPMFIVEVPCTIAGLDIITRFTGPHGGAVATASASLAFDGDGGAFNGGFCHIHHCRFVDWWGAVTGIYFFGGAYNLIEDCCFEGFDAGIQFYSGTHNPDYNTIRRCYFYDNTNGIEMVVGSTPHNCVIQENVFVDYTDAIDFNQAGGGTGDGLVIGNYYETATDAATYDCTVAQAQVIGWNFSDNHYSE